MAFIGVPIQIVNEWIGTRLLCASGAGESMYVHTFGAYFGLTVVFVLHHSNSIDCPDEKSRYTPDIYSMIGTKFLFCFWPSFNAGDETGTNRLYAVTNTYVSICASVVGAFLMSSLLKRGKFDMIHIQNFTLVGGVAVGTVSGSNIGLHGAMMIGTLAGMISVVGFHFLLPKLKQYRIHDTCDVNNLHSIPGLTAGVVGIIVASIGNRSGYLNSLTDVCRDGGKSRNNSTQSAYQAAALGLTFGMAVVGGLITGFMLRLPISAQKERDFDDEEGWHLPEENIKDNNNMFGANIARTAL
ncbi:unnamed protein product [Rotaria magnacalcarata]|nr:unnamed protein product [Rotaria magnacalcarata]CAF3745445.1 unnamed protein product [Rotaria magnacalcarata]